MNYSFSDIQWERNMLSLYPYYPWRSDRRNELTRKILDFKENKPGTVQWFQQCAIEAMNYAEEDFLDIADFWYALSAPRSTANEPNRPCESICQCLASNFLWIYYVPKALVRTQTVPSSAKAYAENRPRTTQVMHEKTIDYAGPALDRSYGIILIDDVLTTTSTFQACCGILRKKTSCEHIFGFFLGRTQLEH
jgi:hypothetical protein